MAAMVAVLPSTFVEAWPAYLAVNGTLFTGRAADATAADARAATANATREIRKFLIEMLLLGWTTAPHARADASAQPSGVRLNLGYGELLTRVR